MITRKKEEKLYSREKLKTLRDDFYGKCLELFRKGKILAFSFSFSHTFI